MRLLIRADPNQLRTSLSFSISGTIHGWLLALVVFGKAAPYVSLPRLLADEAVPPKEMRIVWYPLKGRLPETRPPAGKRPDDRPLRATRKLDQRIVAGPKEDGRPPQIVWSPAPETTAPRIEPLPNVLAIEWKRPTRKFIAPPAMPLTAPQTAWLPAPETAAPRIEPLPNFLAVELKTPTRKFIAPPAMPRTAPQTAWSPAPETAAPRIEPLPNALAIEWKRPTRKFTAPTIGPRPDDGRPPQTAWSPAPETAAPRIEPLPNFLAVELKKPTRKFTAPTIGPRPDDGRPPQTAWSPAPETAVPRIEPLPNALAVEWKRPTRKFTAPTIAPRQDDGRPPQAAWSPAPETAAPRVEPLPNLPAVELKKPTRKFTAPTIGPRPDDGRPPQTAWSPAPETAAPRVEPLPNFLAAELKSPLRTFTAPPASEPRLSTPEEPSDLPVIEAPALAVIGLDAAKMAEIVTPPPSRSAGFSAGPASRPNGAETDGATTSAIEVPGVTVRDGVSRQTLLAAIRPVARAADKALPPPPTRVSTAPDPSLEGRVVYKVAIQMPNITSYSGSWIVWFAEREQTAGGAVRAPSPLHKVDPKYIAAAAAEGVQGIVRLGAVIRKSGRVDSVRLLRHLDERLDRTAMEALAKWEFEPALRGGAPVDVDAVFEIPFRLAPKPLK